LRPGTPDHLPILGPTDMEGLLVATGHYRNGILLAPVTAKLIRGAGESGGPSIFSATIRQSAHECTQRVVAEPCRAWQGGNAHLGPIRSFPRTRAGDARSAVRAAKKAVAGGHSSSLGRRGRV
jgi:hypothetical protein